MLACIKPASLMNTHLCSGGVPKQHVEALVPRLVHPVCMDVKGHIGGPCFWTVPVGGQQHVGHHLPQLPKAADDHLLGVRCLPGLCGNA